MAPRPATAPPVLLKDFITNCQRMSATLPPDNWDETTPPPAVQRHENGTLALSPVRSILTRRVTSAPASLTAASTTGQEGNTREKYCFSRVGWGETPSPAATSESLAVGPPTPTPTNAPAFPRGAMNDSPYPSPSPAWPTPNPPSDIATPARLIPRINTSTSTQHLLSPAPGMLSPSNRVHRPSPLRNVSMPGEENSEIELLPRGLPRAVYELPEPKEEERRRRRGWGWGCCGRRM